MKSLKKSVAEFAKAEVLNLTDLSKLKGGSNNKSNCGDTTGDTCSGSDDHDDDCDNDTDNCPSGLVRFGVAGDSAFNY